MFQYKKHNALNRAKNDESIGFRYVISTIKID